jgi:NCS1 family nucleobase:cation symporter-1
VLCRAAFGVRGANVPAILRAVVACGWFGIQTWIGALALNTLLTTVWGGWAGVRWGVGIAFALFWAFQVVVIAGGIERIKRLGSFVAPVLLSGGTLLLIWGVRHGGGLANILHESARLQGKAAGTVSFWTLFPPALTANVGYWATLSLNIPDFTRYAKSQRSQATGQALGLPTTMTAFAFIGVAVTSASIVIFGEAIWDPIELVKRIGGAGLIIAATLCVLCAQLHTNMAANVVSPSNDFSNLSPRRISFVKGGLITAVIGILMMPWKLYADASAYIFNWLVGYSSLMGALGGILIADYWVLRRQRLDVAALFSERGIYRYTGGVNWRAMIALAVGVAPVVPGFVRAALTPGGLVASPDVFDTLYSYAWFVTFALSFVLYLALMRGSSNAFYASQD